LDFKPDTTIRVPSGAKARVHANMAVIDVLDRLDAEQRPATADEHETLAAWSGWGAVPEVFDRRNDAFAVERAHLRGQLNPDQYRAAEASILNAHYTDPAPSPRPCGARSAWRDFPAGACWNPDADPAPSSA
jgi:hypothetical protein